MLIRIMLIVSLLLAYCVDAYGQSVDVKSKIKDVVIPGVTLSSDGSPFRTSPIFPSQNENGDIVFQSSTMANANLGVYIYHTSSGLSERVLLRGDPDDMGSTADFLTPLGINASGAVLIGESFFGDLQNKIRRLYYWRGGILFTIASTSKKIPGGTDTFSQIIFASFNNREVIAFSALARAADGTNRYLLLIWRRGVVQIVLSGGDVDPVTGIPYVAFGRVVINAKGELAFLAVVRDFGSTIPAIRLIEKLSKDFKTTTLVADIGFSGTLPLSTMDLRDLSDAGDVIFVGREINNEVSEDRGIFLWQKGVISQAVAPGMRIGGFLISDLLNYNVSCISSDRFLVVAQVDDGRHVIIQKIFGQEPRAVLLSDLYSQILISDRRYGKTYFGKKLVIRAVRSDIGKIVNATVSIK